MWGHECDFPQKSDCPRLNPLPTGGGSFLVSGLGASGDFPTPPGFTWSVVGDSEFDLGTECHGYAVLAAMGLLGPLEVAGMANGTKTKGMGTGRGHCNVCAWQATTVDFVYQRLIVYGLDREFILTMQHIARVAMLPADSNN